MTTVVLVVLALAWVAVLGFWFRSRAQGGLGDSVGLFHRHLHVLGRAAPGTLTPANRLRGPGAAPVPLAVRLGHQPVATRATATARPLAGGFGRPLGAAGRHQSRRRRRDVLFVLVVLVVATLVLAVATAARDLIVLQLLADAALAGYVALLVRLRNLAAERDLKLRYLRQPAARAAATAPVRRSRPRTQPAAYAFGGGYGELDLRRAVGD